MKIIRNSIIPFKGFAAINLFGILFVRRGVLFTKDMENHERIHTARMKEMMYIFFYLWYVFEWIARLFMKGNAYRNISFEREAHINEMYLKYLKVRKPYSCQGLQPGAAVFPVHGEKPFKNKPGGGQG